MAQLGPLTVTVSISLGTTKLPIPPITFEVPLQAVEDTKLTEGAVTYIVDLDRTELREQLTKSVRTIADQVEGAFLTPGAVLLTCDVCDAQIVSEVLATLRHEASGAHSLGAPAYARASSALPDALGTVGEAITPEGIDPTEGDQTNGKDEA